MPSLIRLLFVLGLLSGLAYGGILTLATFVQPQQREMTATVPQDRLIRHR
ncbi:MAG: histidine kinase [Rhizobiales bacterium]|nr:histidine kinase [Hyphomicrobiales bacterium]